MSELWEKVRKPGPYVLTESLFLRLLGLVYLAAFASFWPQIKGLIGSEGIVPAARELTEMRAALGAKAFLDVPSLFWFHMSDTGLIALCVAGCIAALVLVSGFVPRVAAAACWALYLSIVSIGQPFTAFQWDALLLEAGFLAVFAGSPWLVWAYRFLLFRLMFESGVVKLASGDPNWRNLHALRFHFMTQPLPTPLAYYCYRLPTSMLDSMTALTLAIELTAPFLLFCPKRARYIGTGLLIILQVLILLTGNYAFFNLLTLALCLWSFDDTTFAPLGRWLRKIPPVHGRIIRRVSATCLAVLVCLALMSVLGMLGIGPGRLFAFLEPFEIVNTYGLFAVMTTTRPEILIEGSNDLVNWKEYSFLYKPGNLHRGLPLIAPYQPRLDWQMWFAALGSYQQNAWAGNLMYRVLQGDSVVLGLMGASPFTTPPRYLRAQLYDYTFTTPVERAKTGAVWQRRFLQTWFGPVALKQ